MTLRDDVFNYVKKKYKSKPEYLWRKFPDYVVFRHEDNSKWYALLMDVPGNKLGLANEERVDIINVKMSDPFFVDTMIQKDGYFRGYHISKGNWISILLDGTVPVGEIYGLIDESFLVTASKKAKEKVRPPKEWIIPANPKYYDIVHAFDDTDTIDWKQGKGIKSGDTVFIYVAAPVSAVLFKCKVTKTDIPYNLIKKELTITALMEINLLKRYEADRFTFDVLKEKYGIYAVRGPRGIPNSLSEDFKRS